MIELNIIKLYENLAKLNEAKSDIDNFIDKFGEETYELFKRSTQRLKNKGISTDLTYHVKYTDKKDLDSILINLQNRAITKDGNLTEIDGDYEYIGEGKGYKVYKINDAVASINLGADTGWCISGRYGHYGEKNYTPSRDEAEKHWNSYVKEGAKFYFFIGNEDKVALALYPRTISVNKIRGNAFVEWANFELYDERDNLNYDLLSNLPVNLIKRTVIFKSHPVKNGLYIEDNVLVTCDERLKDVLIPNNVTSIAEQAFENCSSLTNITIPHNVTNIEDNAFYNCTGLTSITIPDSVESIGKSAFSACSNLKSVVIGDGVTIISDDLFIGCDSLTTVTIGNSVTSIGSYAFYNCSNLKSINIPDSVTSIGTYAFAGCWSLEGITLPDGITTIHKGTFLYCQKLKNITIPDSVTSIGINAFSKCDNLTSVAIGNSVTSIDYSAFSGCPNLKNIQVSANNPNYKVVDGHLYNNNGKMIV